jgi:hypothetical protein
VRLTPIGHTCMHFAASEGNLYVVPSISSGSSQMPGPGVSFSASGWRSSLLLHSLNGRAY